MRYLKFLIVLILFLISCEDKAFNSKDKFLDIAKISNCNDVINQLEYCLDIHEGALEYLEKSCSIETVSFVKENLDSCESLVNYFVKM